MRQDNCTRCGYTLVPEDQVCPKCKLPVRREELTPLGGGPLVKNPVARPRDEHQEREEAYRPEYAEPVEGQEHPGSFGYIKFIAKQDPLLASVFGLLALEALVAIAGGGLLWPALCVAVFWGVYTFQLWGYWLALAGSLLGLLLALQLYSQIAWAAIVGGILSAFTILILSLRKQYFG